MNPGERMAAHSEGIHPPPPSSERSDRKVKRLVRDLERFAHSTDVLDVIDWGKLRQTVSYLKDDDLMERIKKLEANYDATLAQDSQE